VLISWLQSLLKVLEQAVVLVPLLINKMLDH
jgi:hypothetical protein